MGNVYYAAQTRLWSGKRGSVNGGSPPTVAIQDRPVSER